MKFGISYNLVCPRPLDTDQWGPDDEHKLIKEALEQIEFADKLGFDYVWGTEHHFLEEYSISSAPEVLLAAASQRDEEHPPRPRHRPHAAEAQPPGARRRAHRHARPRSPTAASSSAPAKAPRSPRRAASGTPRAEKKEAWEEATRECLRMMTMTPYPGYEGIHFSMPERNVIPKPLQKPHPPLWVAASRLETAMLGARFGMGALGVGFETPEEADERVKRYYELVAQHQDADRPGDEPGDRRPAPT